MVIPGKRSCGDLPKGIGTNPKSAKPPWTWYGPSNFHIVTSVCGGWENGTRDCACGGLLCGRRSRAGRSNARCEPSTRLQRSGDHANACNAQPASGNFVAFGAKARLPNNPWEAVGRRWMSRGLADSTPQPHATTSFRRFGPGPLPGPSDATSGPESQMASSQQFQR